MNFGQLELDILQGIFSLLGVVLTVAVPIVVPRLLDVLRAHHVAISQQQEQLVVNAIHDAAPRALNAAEHLAEGQIDPTKKYDLGSPFMNAAMNYMIQNKGQMLDAMGVSTSVDSEQLRQLLLAHLPGPASPMPSSSAVVVK